MTRDAIKFVSMSCQGLSNSLKRADTLNSLRSKKYSVYLLQDTHFTNKEKHYIRTQWCLNATSVILVAKPGE